MKEIDRAPRLTAMRTIPAVIASFVACFVVCFALVFALPSFEGTASAQSNTVTSLLAARIHRRTATQYRVERGAITTGMANLGVLARQAHVVPRTNAAGDIVGLRMSGIRRGSIPFALGLRNGDEIQSIEGHRLGTPEAAMAAYQALQGAARVRLQLRRRGRPLTIVYQIVD